MPFVVEDEAGEQEDVEDVEEGEDDVEVEDKEEFVSPRAVTALFIVQALELNERADSLCTIAPGVECSLPMASLSSSTFTSPPALMI